MANHQQQSMKITLIIWLIIIICNKSLLIDGSNDVGWKMVNGIAMSPSSNQMELFRSNRQSNDSTDDEPCDTTVNQCMNWCGEIVRRPGKCPNGQMCCLLIY
ncbi:uncharacterized protein LOC113796979 isoform X1 [Dermatophagoides pteronyssinus]|uniref:uncharacterized protein LOC113796979 isoform X1 n=1 Tax=Dermatophagoides pteronyssinus TaxID=6956 RepID=UPI003F664545